MSKKKYPKDSAFIYSLRVTKLKKTTPNTSERLLSYTTNSYLDLFNVLAVEIATALLIIAKGIEFVKLSLNEIFAS